MAPDETSAKRVLDVALASITLLLCLPLLAAITLAIAADSRGPVLYRQRRVGWKGLTAEQLSDLAFADQTRIPLCRDLD